MAELVKTKVIAVLRSNSFEQAFSSAQIALQSGIDTLEVTFTTPKAAELIAQLREEYPDKLIGAGTIIQLGEAEAAVEAGAQFFLSPHFDKKLSDWFKSKNLNYIPGGMTPTELMAIKNAGHPFQKLFPAGVLGPDGIKTILGPMPQLNLVVTGGVTLENARAFLKAGAASVCVGSALFSRELMLPESSNALAKECMKWSSL